MLSRSNKFLDVKNRCRNEISITYKLEAITEFFGSLGCLQRWQNLWVTLLKLIWNLRSKKSRFKHLKNWILFCNKPLTSEIFVRSGPICYFLVNIFKIKKPRIDFINLIPKYKKSIKMLTVSMPSIHLLLLVYISFADERIDIFSKKVFFFLPDVEYIHVYAYLNHFSNFTTLRK